MRLKKRVNKQEDDVCHPCGEKGHWCRNWKAYLEEKRYPKGIYFIENIFYQISLLVFDIYPGYIFEMVFNSKQEVKG